MATTPSLQTTNKTSLTKRPSYMGKTLVITYPSQAYQVTSIHHSQQQQPTIYTHTHPQVDYLTSTHPS